MGIVGAETTSIHTQIVGLLCPFTVQHKKEFLSLEKLGEMHKNVRESPTLLTWVKTTSPTPKSWPLSSHSPSNTENEFWAWGKWRKTTNHEGERAQQDSPTWESLDVNENGWGNERNGCIIAYSFLPNILLDPQVKNTLSKNGWLPKFEFDLHTFPILRI